MASDPSRTDDREDPDEREDGGASAGDGARDSVHEEREPVPESWKEVKGSCGVSLTGPDLIAVPAQGTDSCVGRFESEECVYAVDLGGFSNSLESASYVSEDILVEGKPARLVYAPEKGENFFAGVHVPALWGSSSRVSVTVTAQCGNASGQATALRVLRTLNLPDDERAASATVKNPCTGDDERPIRGYTLGFDCPVAKVTVHDVCAVGAKANNATGSGQMLCFLDRSGYYYWAFVAFGETITGLGARHGPGEIWGNQLGAHEAERCQTMIDKFTTSTAGTRDLLTGEYIAQGCPP